MVVLAYILALVALLAVGAALGMLWLELRDGEVPEIRAALQLLAERTGNAPATDELARQLLALQEDTDRRLRNVLTELGEIDEKVEHRYRKLTARQRRDAKAAVLEELGDDSPETAVAAHQLAFNPATNGFAQLPRRMGGRQPFRR